ncbi:MAG: response regulator [Anaerovoracaceae bacterium]
MKNLKGMKILYVEDDAQAREELTEVLKRRAGKVMVGENGLQGLALYEHFRPDIILADLYMPEMDGVEMIRKIRLLKGNPVVIVTSAVEDVDTILNAVDAGIDKYLLKPVNLQELLDVLGDFAEAIQSKRQPETAYLGENKKQIEAEIKKNFAAFLKNTTGKGPRDVIAFIGNSQIEIMASDVLTVFEKNLLDNNQNIAIIKHNRKLFFSVKEKEICQLIGKDLGQDLRLKEVFIDIENDKNKLLFAIG